MNGKSLLLLLLLFLQQQTKAQEAKPDKRITDKACDCINKIDPNLLVNAKSDSIRSCISVASISVQIMDQMTGKLKKQAIEGSKDSASVIIADKDVDLIQEALLQECSYLRMLLMTDNEKLENSVSKNSKAMAFHKQGSAYFNEGKYESAIKEFKKALKIDPKFAFAWDDLGLSYRKLNDFNEAIKCYKKSLELDPKGRTPLMNMAVAFQMLNDNKSALRTYVKYIELNPNDPEGYYGIARIYRFEKEYENGLENAFKALEMYDELKSPYVQDAINVIREIVGDLKKEKKVNIYNQFAEKHGLEKIKE